MNIYILKPIHINIAVVTVIKSQVLVQLQRISLKAAGIVKTHSGELNARFALPYKVFIKGLSEMFTLRTSS